MRKMAREKASQITEVREGFQVNSTVKKRLRNSKRRIKNRLRKRRWQEQRRRMFPDRNIHYDIAHKVRGGRFGGLGACLLLTKRLDLADAMFTKMVTAFSRTTSKHGDILNKPSHRGMRMRSIT